MSFSLRRLPFVAISEVIKSMDIIDIFLFSLASKKSQNFVMLSIPKNSFSADFTLHEDGFLFELMPTGFMKEAVDIIPVFPYITERESEIMGFSTCGLYIQCEWNDTSEVAESVRKLFTRFSKLFKKSKNHMNFDYETKEEIAMQIMRFAWGTGFPLDHIDFSLEDVSSESIQELLDECNEQHTTIDIKSFIPFEFKCTPPPGGYKFKSLVVHDAHWVNLDDFLQCRKVYLLDFLPKLAVKYLNGLLKKIINMECRIQSFFFQLKSIKPTDFPKIVRGLSESEIKQEGTRQRLDLKRKDGLKLMISLSNGYLDLEEDSNQYKIT